jgi:hypothetical protein
MQVQAWDASKLGLHSVCAHQDIAGKATSNSCICWVCCSEAVTQKQAFRQANGKPSGLYEVTIGTTGKISGVFVSMAGLFFALINFAVASTI